MERKKYIDWDHYRLGLNTQTTHTHTRKNQDENSVVIGLEHRFTRFNFGKLWASFLFYVADFTKWMGQFTWSKLDGGLRLDSLNNEVNMKLPV